MIRRQSLFLTRLPPFCGLSAFDEDVCHDVGIHNNHPRPYRFALLVGQCVLGVLAPFAGVVPLGTVQRSIKNRSRLRPLFCCFLV